MHLSWENGYDQTPREENGSPVRWPRKRHSGVYSNGPVMKTMSSGFLSSKWTDSDYHCILEKHMQQKHGPKWWGVLRLSPEMILHTFITYWLEAPVTFLFFRAHVLTGETETVWLKVRYRPYWRMPCHNFLSSHIIVSLQAHMHTCPAWVSSCQVQGLNHSRSCVSPIP